MTVTYTPGLWSVINPSCGAVGIEEPHKLIASVFGDHPECEADERQRMNCLLIAAAPDLLKALKILTANIETAFPAMANLGPLASARKAIAKATGETCAA